MKKDSPEKLEKEDNEEKTDRPLTLEEIARMYKVSQEIKEHLSDLLKRGFVIKRESTNTPGLFRITVRDPFTNSIVFYEDEEVLYGDDDKNRTSSNWN
jgi:chromosome segregation and condensation protein ScpB